MPLVGYTCPDGTEILRDDCIAECRLAEPCRPLAVRKRLELIDRKLEGFSTTQLIQPTCQMYLLLTQDYYQSFDKLEYLLEGSIMHNILQVDIADALQEERLKDNVNSGKFDIYYDEVLEDYKRVGMYKIERILSGEEPYEYTLQLNDYRIKLETAGFPVKQMYVWLVGRDYNYLHSRKGFVKWNRVEIERKPDPEIKTYFRSKALALRLSLEKKEVLYPCTKEIDWNDFGGKRCKDWCAVNFACDYYKKRGGE